MNCWIQRHDLSAEDFVLSDANDAISKFESFDWLSELEKKINEDKKETCPPGIGFVSGQGEILHICPQDNEINMIHFHYPEPSKILWVIPVASQKTITRNKISKDTVYTLIKLFFEKSYTKIIATL